MNLAFTLENAVTLPAAARPAPEEATAPAPVLSVGLSGGNLSISWAGGGTLQYANDLAGPWNDLEGANSPYLAPPDAPQRFYRVKIP